jgi:hypothetical protein
MTITPKNRGNKKPTRDTQRVFFCCDRRNTPDREGLVADLLSQDAGQDVRVYDRNIVCAMPFMMIDTTGAKWQHNQQKNFNRRRQNGEYSF